MITSDELRRIEERFDEHGRFDPADRKRIVSLARRQRPAPTGVASTLAPVPLSELLSRAVSGDDEAVWELAVRLTAD